MCMDIYIWIYIWIYIYIWILNSWPLNNTRLNCVGLLIYGFFSINTVNIFSLPYDFLNNIFSSLFYCKNTVSDTYNIQNMC